MQYPHEAYFLFLLALVLFLGGLGLLGAVIEWREDRKARRQEQHFKDLNRREDLHRRHHNYLAQMDMALAEKGRGA